MSFHRSRRFSATHTKLSLSNNIGIQGHDLEERLQNTASRMTSCCRYHGQYVDSCRVIY